MEDHVEGTVRSPGEGLSPWSQEVPSEQASPPRSLLPSLVLSFPALVLCRPESVALRRRAGPGLGGHVASGGTVLGTRRETGAGCPPPPPPFLGIQLCCCVTC